MKLCFVADGRSIHTQRWCEYFAGRHEVHLVTYDPVGRPIDGVTEHVVGSPGRNLYLAFWPRHLRVTKIIRQVKPDLVHAHFIAKYGFHLPFLDVRPAVVSAWGDDILVLPRKSRLIAAFTRRVLEHADLVWAVSQNIRDRIVEDFGIPEEKVRYLPFGVDTRLFAPPPAPEGDPGTVRVLSNRGFDPVYDAKTVVEGFSAAYRQDSRLRLVMKGDGPLRAGTRDLVHSLGLDGVVSFPGRSPHGEVPRDYREAEIWVSAARSDGTPVSLLEAMSAGLPCVATRVGGVPEWIEDGEDGLLIPPGDSAALADRLLRLAARPDLRTSLGARARRRVVQDGDWCTLMPRAEKEYGELVARWRG
ncbi:MAG: glycosyltransferase family 4 protein [Methanospirillum sp.]|nr:glycosyltransferase family 4 protein [Methanospirillum sp.]